MIKILLNIFFLTLIINNSLNSQTINFCSFEDLVFEERVIKEINPSNAPISYRTGETLCLRTVIHILGNNTQGNIADSTIIDLINQVNLLLTTQDIDTSFIHLDHRSLLGDSGIQFHLAQFDPENNPTNGITRTLSNEYFSISNFQDSINIEPLKQDSLGGKSAWDTEKYFNIWIAPMGNDSLDNNNYGIPNSNFFPLGTSGIIGVGTPGAVIDIDHILNESTPNVLCHEIGHALGLLHPWGWPPNCEVDDYIDDTPASMFSGSPCSGTNNTCIDSIGDKVDNLSNIMGYSCMLMFTPNQIEIIKNNVFNHFQGGIIENEECGQFTSSSNPELDKEFILQVYPNPNNGRFLVEYDQQEISDINFAFFNSLGNLVHSETIINTKSIRKEFNLSTFQNGILIMVISSKNIVHSKKIVIHN